MLTAGAHVSDEPNNLGLNENNNTEELATFSESLKLSRPPLIPKNTCV